MSKTLFVSFRSKGFWAYDVLASVFLRQLIIEARAWQTLPGYHWLEEAVNAWRVNAIYSDFGFHLDEQWSNDQICTVVDLCRAAVQSIEAGGDIPATAILSEPMINNDYIFLRGLDPVPHRPVVRLGYALILLLEGTFPDPPLGFAWMYDMEPKVRTISVRGTIDE